MNRKLTIVSGGQSGVDRAALDFAVRNQVEYAGWCPKGGWAEDYVRPPGLLAKYDRLRETPSTDTNQRTEWNVRDSDATAIIVDGVLSSDSKGTRFTKDIANLLQKPAVTVNCSDPRECTAFWSWLREGETDLALNIAGPRESECPGIYLKTLALLNAFPADLFDNLPIK